MYIRNVKTDGIKVKIRQLEMWEFFQLRLWNWTFDSEIPNSDIFRL